MLNRRLTAIAKEAVKSDIRLYYFVRHRLMRMRFLLPHDSDFWAFSVVSKRPGIFLDIGANDGISALSFRTIDRETPILSIEPNPLHRHDLDRVASRIPKFDFKILAAGDYESSLPLFTPIYKGYRITSYASHSEEAARDNIIAGMRISRVADKIRYERTEVSVVPLDQLGLSPKAIKIDVEGFEDKALFGLRTTLTQHRPIIMLEYNPRSYESASQFLKGLDYRAFSFDPKRKAFWPYSGENRLNIFFIHCSMADTLPLRSI